ncbi:hypothetical protein BB559_007053 [Furculomyces boomerangus]|uniref:FMP27 C-terminal domain-containing protein n=1 Tax=Furculomyces boomerangus TaxID=61424 RepID=A0A2T9XZ90_9FUNG|nr:hypothetical protein BB559_007053 [Furculomyces boomerangus]
MSQINISCTSEQYASIITHIADLLIYSEPKRSLYLEALNTIKLTTDLASIAKQKPNVSHIQESLRMRKRMMQAWLERQWDSTNLFPNMLSDGGFVSNIPIFRLETSGQGYVYHPNSTVPALSNEIHRKSNHSILFQEFQECVDNSTKVLILSRQIKALEHQLRITMDVISAAQKYMSTINQVEDRYTLDSDDTSSFSDISDFARLPQDKEATFNPKSHKRHASMVNTTQHQPDTISENTESKNSMWSSLDKDPSNIPSIMIRKSMLDLNTPTNKPIEMHTSKRSGEESKSKKDRTSITKSKNFKNRNTKRSPTSMHNSEDLNGSKRHSVAQFIHAHFASVNWRMLDNSYKPICDWKLRNLNASLTISTNKANDVSIQADLILALNRLPNSMYPEIIMPYNSNITEPVNFSKNKMIKIYYSELPPVGGIRIVELLEVDLSPLRIQFSHDIGKLLIDYLFPVSEPQPNDDDFAVSGNFFTESGKQPTQSFKNTTHKKSSKLSFLKGLTHSHDNLVNDNIKSNASSPGASPKSSLNRFLTKNHYVALSETSSVLESELLRTKSASQPPEIIKNSLSSQFISKMHKSETPQQKDMKTKASENKTFILVKISGHRHIISFHGPKRRNLADLSNFEFNSPKLEFHNEVLTYHELAMRLKRAFINAAFQHTGALLKEKFKQISGRSNTSNVYEDVFTKEIVQQIDEADNKRKLLNFFGGHKEAGSTSVPESNKLESIEKKIQQSEPIRNMISTSLFTPSASHNSAVLVDISNKKRKSFTQTSRSTKDSTKSETSSLKKETD